MIHLAISENGAKAHQLLTIEPAKLKAFIRHMRDHPQDSRTCKIEAKQGSKKVILNIEPWRLCFMSGMSRLEMEEFLRVWYLIPNKITKVPAWLSIADSCAFATGSLLNDKVNLLQIRVSPPSTFNKSSGSILLAMANNEFDNRIAIACVKKI